MCLCLHTFLWKISIIRISSVQKYVFEWLCGVLCIQTTQTLRALFIYPVCESGVDDLFVCAHQACVEHIGDKKKENETNEHAYRVIASEILKHKPLWLCVYSYAYLVELHFYM